jgi:hypothetical protein
MTADPVDRADQVPVPGGYRGDERLLIVKASTEPQGEHRAVSHHRLNYPLVREDLLRRS